MVLLAVSCTYFYPQLSGKAISQPDTNHSYRGTKESWDYYAKNGKRNLWTNSQFGGMPTIQVGGLENKNIYQYLGKVSTFMIKRPIGTFLFGSISMYILFMVLGVSTWLAAIGSLAFAFSTQYIILYSIGHNSKLDVLMTLPIILAGGYSLFRKNYLGGLILLSLGLGLNIYRNHYQMTWYIGIFMLVYYIIETVQALQKNERQHIGQVAMFSLIALVVAIGPSTTRILTTLDYTPESIRGKKIVEDRNTEEASTAESGLTWQFATRFSYDFVDLGSLIVPRFAGGGGKERISNTDPLAKEVFRTNYKNKSSKVATYYGKQPFTEGPSYLGVVIVLLFMIGLFSVSSQWRWWSIICVAFGVIYALGSTLGGFHKFLFESIPLFDRFRAPSSFLSAIVMFFPLIGILGLQRYLDSDNNQKYLKPALGIGGAFAAFFATMYAVGPSVIDMTHEADQYMKNAGIAANVIQEQRVDFFRSDVLRALILVLLTVGSLWAYGKKKISSKILVIAIGALSLFDIFGVDYRYIYPDRFTKKSSQVGKFQPSPPDVEILKDKDPHFRVFDLSQDPFRTSDVSYFHKSLGGYNAAKLRRYNDIIDYYLKKGNSTVASMLNAKYYIKKNQNGEAYAERNPNAMGNAWFVDQIQFVQNDQAEIDRLGTINPLSTAIVHQEFAGELGGLTPSKNGSVKLTKYSPVELNYQYNSPQENLIVFSEVWYGPDKGWQAYIDNKPVDHIRTNYILRALRVPEGSHSVKFVFDPASYKIGEIISLIFSVLTGGALLYLLYLQVQKSRLNAAPVPAKKKKKPTKVRKKKK